MTTIKFEKNENGVATLTFNRPEVFNSFNDTMRREVLAAFAEVEATPSVRCLVITGAGKAFCAGQDLSEAIAAKDTLSFKKVLEEGFNLIALKIRTLEIPVVVAVNGVAAGAGANLALLGDVVVATASASFVQAFSKIGLVPDCGGTFILPRLVGFGKASALMMLNDKVSAQEAEQMGMIYKCFDDAVFLENVENIATQLAKMPTRGLALAKRALNASAQHNLEEQLRFEADLQEVAGKTHDYTEGVAAFVEKRKPNFIGS